MESAIIRKIDDLGRIVIPKDMRNRFGMNSGDEIEFFFHGDFICLRKRTLEEQTSCVNCPYRNGK